MRGSSGEVVRNTTMAGHDIGGLDRRELRAVVADVDARLRGSTVRIEAGDSSFEASAAELGVSVDAERTIEEALDVGRSGSAVGRPFSWLASLVSDREAPVRVGVDEGVLAPLVVARDPERKAPVEPSIEQRDGRYVGVEGKDGRGLRSGDVARALREAAESGEVPIVVEVEQADIPPTRTLEDAEELADEANDLTADPLPLQAGGTTVDAPPEMLRTWLRAATTSEGLLLTVDAETVLKDLPGLFPDVGDEPKDARFVIEGDSVRVVPGEQGTACCGGESPQLVLDAITQRGGEPPDLPLTAVDPELTAEEAAGMGVKEPIAEFTTRHPCCQSRVTNIHRIADIVRGVVIPPGERFSVNEFVGRRTTANGFVTGGVIQNGVFEESVGGGISQFATTTFNAAFFGGLEIPEYQSHSIYISRYPYGREATLSFPRPDLVLENNTPYGVVLWPTYTDTTITMTLWSTKWVSGEQTGQTESPAGSCTRVTTERTRTYLEDGRTEVDYVFATYRPGEGIDC